MTDEQLEIAKGKVTPHYFMPSTKHYDDVHGVKMFLYRKYQEDGPHWYLEVKYDDECELFYISSGETIEQKSLEGLERFQPKSSRIGLVLRLGSIETELERDYDLYNLPGYQALAVGSEQFILMVKTAKDKKEVMNILPEHMKEYVRVENVGLIKPA